MGEVFGSIWSVVRPDLLAAIGLPLAVVVSVHVLLTKRDVAASIGWIGLAWLSPIVGAGLYYLFGIGRVTRRARLARHGGATPVSQPPPPSLALPPQLTLLDRAAQRITGERVEPGNRVSVLRNGDDAYRAMLDAIAGARTSVALSSYLMRADVVGMRFIETLAVAAARGVAVRVLLDGIGSGYFLPGAYGALRTRGVPVARFMHSPLPWRMPFLNLRNHKKLLAVDGRTTFLGGMNIGDEDLRRRGANVRQAGRRQAGRRQAGGRQAREREPGEREAGGRGDGPLVLDTHFCVEGPVARELVADFARDWAFVTGEELAGPNWFPAIAPLGTAALRAVPSGPDEDIEKIEFVMLQAFACARRSIRMMSPYFLPSELVVTSLAMASMRGVTVDIVVPERSNHRYVDWAMRAHVGPLIERGVRIWRNPPPFDHSKLLVVDEAWSFVGSANLDMRSLRLNFELNVEIYDAELSRGLADFMDARRIRPLGRDEIARRGFPARIRDAALRLGLPYL